MQDKKLLWMVVLLTMFVTAHNIDHFIRDGVSLPLVVVVALIYALIGAVLFLYWKHKVGSRFFTIATVSGFAFGWFAHFSPATKQPLTIIFAAYESAIAGWLALASLFGIMLILAVIAIYCSYHWSKR